MWSKEVKRRINDLALEGGSAKDVAPIKKELDETDIDYASISPEPDLTIA